VLATSKDANYNQETKVQNALYDVASNIRQSGPTAAYVLFSAATTTAGAGGWGGWGGGWGGWGGTGGRDGNAGSGETGGLGGHVSRRPGCASSTLAG